MEKSSQLVLGVFFLWPTLVSWTWSSEEAKSAFSRGRTFYTGTLLQKEFLLPRSDPRRSATYTVHIWPFTLQLGWKMVNWWAWLGDRTSQ